MAALAHGRGAAVGGAGQRRRRRVYSPAGSQGARAVAHRQLPGIPVLCGRVLAGDRRLRRLQYPGGPLHGQPALPGDCVRGVSDLCIRRSVRELSAAPARLPTRRQDCGSRRPRLGADRARRLGVCAGLRPGAAPTCGACALGRNRRLRPHVLGHVAASLRPGHAREQRAAGGVGGLPVPLAQRHRLSAFPGGPAAALALHQLHQLGWLRHPRLGGSCELRQAAQSYLRLPGGGHPTGQPGDRRQGVRRVLPVLTLRHPSPDRRRG